MNRRDFLKLGMSAAGFGALGGCRSLLDGGGLSVAGLRIGVQMWSVHELWKKDPVGAFRRLKALGYDGVQSFGFLAMDWNELEKMLDGEGLRIVDMPFYMNNVQADKFGEFIEFCQRFHIDFAYEPSTKCKTAEDWRKHIPELLAAKEKFAKCGIRVGFHNHQIELKPTDDGTIPLQLLCEAGFDAELDVGHVKLAGGDPVDWLKRVAGRVPAIHAKPGGGNSVGGPGDRNDWPAIFTTARACGAKWAIVECETRRNTFEDVERTMEYLRGV